MMAREVRQAAEEYIGKGYSVVALRPRTKRPIHADWPSLTITADNVGGYFSNGENVGVKTGTPSGSKVDVDLDTSEALSIAGWFLRPTLTSGRERAPHSHWWYVSPGAETADFKDYCEGLKGEMLVELRAEGRQTVVWPSVHPDDGDRYVWHEESGLEMAEVSSEELTRAVRELATATLIARHVPPVGGRHDFALALTGFMLREDRFDRETTLKILRAAWHAAGADSKEALRDLEGIVEDTADKLARGEPVKGGVALNQIVEGMPKNISKFWGWQYEAWEDPVPLPTGLPPVDELDPAMLPDTFRPWLSDVAERMQVPVCLPAATAMTAVSIVVGRKLGIRPKRHDDWLVVPNLWGALVGRPSLLKSPALAEGMKPLNRLVANAYEHHRRELEDYEYEALVIEARGLAFKEELKKKAREAARSGDRSRLTEFVETEGRIEEPESPTVRRYRTEDTTVEKLCELLIENPNGLLVHRDELSGWLRSLDKQGREGDRAFFLEGWNGTGSFSVDRIGRGLLHVPALCLSVLGSIQPGPLSSYVYQATRGEQGDDGLLQRFQLLVWPDPPKTWRNVDRFPDAEAKNRAYEAFERLDRISVEPDEDDEGGVPYLRFEDGAQEVFDEWRAELEHRLRTEEMPPALESHLAKYRSLMPSLALLFELIDSEEMPPRSVGRLAVMRAAAWCRYLESHAKRLYSAAERPEMASARVLLERMRKGDVRHGTRVREVYRRQWSKLTTPAEVDGALAVLADFGWLRTRTEKTGKRGRESVIVELHPSLREES